MSYVAKRIIYQVEQFRGTHTLADEDFGTDFITERRVLSRNDTSTPWASAAMVQEFVDQNGRVVSVGDCYEREVKELEPGVYATPGPWRFVGPRPAIQDEYVACQPARQPLRAPGQPMVDQFGLQVRAADGSLVLRPASGQQDIDPRTGLPLVDAQGQPVLVP